MCVNLMKQSGIYRVYYSNDKGEICYCRVNNIDSDTYTYATKGLEQMLRNHREAFSIVGKFPLTRKQKSLFVTGKVRRPSPPRSSSPSPASP